MEICLKNLCNFSRSEFFFSLFGFFLFFFSPVEQLVRSALHFRRVRSPHKRMCACGYVISGKWGQRVSKSRPTFALINHELRFSNVWSHTLNVVNKYVLLCTPFYNSISFKRWLNRRRNWRDQQWIRTTTSPLFIGVLYNVCVAVYDKYRRNIVLNTIK